MKTMTVMAKVDQMRRPGRYLITVRSSAMKKSIYIPIRTGRSIGSCTRLPEVTARISTSENHKKGLFRRFIMLLAVMI
jgi:hypothetical protein